MRRAPASTGTRPRPSEGGPGTSATSAPARGASYETSQRPGRCSPRTSPESQRSRARTPTPRAREEPVAEERKVAAKDAHEDAARGDRPPERGLARRIHHRPLCEGQDHQADDHSGAERLQKRGESREVRLPGLAHHRRQRSENQSDESGRRNRQDDRDSGKQKEVTPVHSKRLVQEIADLERPHPEGNRRAHPTTRTWCKCTRKALHEKKGSDVSQHAELAPDDVRVLFVEDDPSVAQM